MGDVHTMPQREGIGKHEGDMGKLMSYRQYFPMDMSSLLGTIFGTTPNYKREPYDLSLGKAKIDSGSYHIAPDPTP